MNIPLTSFSKFGIVGSAFEHLSIPLLAQNEIDRINLVILALDWHSGIEQENFVGISCILPVLCLHIWYKACLVSLKSV